MTTRTQIVSSAAQRIARKEVAAKLPEWIEGMSPASRKAYLKQHPDSKYAAQLQQAMGSGDKVADKHNETIKQAAADAKAVRAQIKSLKEQLPDPIETRADKAKATRINKKIADLMTTLQEHKATALKAKTLLEKRQAKKAEPAPEPVVTKPTPKAAKEAAPKADTPTSYSANPKEEYEPDAKAVSDAKAGIAHQLKELDAARTRLVRATGKEVQKTKNDIADIEEKLSAARDKLVSLMQGPRRR